LVASKPERAGEKQPVGKGGKDVALSFSKMCVPLLPKERVDARCVNGHGSHFCIAIPPEKNLIPAKARNLGFQVWLG
jgi:hypothetical protein